MAGKEAARPPCGVPSFLEVLIWVNDEEGVVKGEVNGRILVQLVAAKGGALVAVAHAHLSCQRLAEHHSCKRLRGLQTPSSEDEVHEGAWSAPQAVVRGGRAVGQWRWQ